MGIREIKPALVSALSWSSTAHKAIGGTPVIRVGLATQAPVRRS